MYHVLQNTYDRADHPPPGLFLRRAVPCFAAVLLVLACGVGSGVSSPCGGADLNVSVKSGFGARLNPPFLWVTFGSGRTCRGGVDTASVVGVIVRRSFLLLRCVKRSRP